jgi:hypothetical protein
MKVSDLVVRCPPATDCVAKIPSSVPEPMTRSPAEPHGRISGIESGCHPIVLALEAALSRWPADRAATQVLLQPRAVTANGIGCASYLGT